MAAPLQVLWQAWTSPAARAVWSAPTPGVKVELLEADTRVGGREVSLCKAEGQPDIRCECGWFDLQPARRSVNYEVISSEGTARSAALVTADFSGTDEHSRVGVTVQLSSLAGTMEADYRHGFDAGLANLADGTVYPNHHLYTEVRPRERIAYTLLWGENGPKHADAWASFEEQAGATTVILGMVFSTEVEFQTAKGFGAIELGLQTLGKLERRIKYDE